MQKIMQQPMSVPDTPSRKAASFSMLFGTYIATLQMRLSLQGRMSDERKHFPDQIKGIIPHPRARRSTPPTPSTGSSVFQVALLDPRWYSCLHCFPSIVLDLNSSYLMIKIIRRFRDKYRKISKHSEYVSVSEILNDLYRLEQEYRLKQIPKNER